MHEQKNPGKFEEKDESRFFGTPPVKGFHVAYIKFKSKKSLSSVEKFVKQTKTPIYLSEPENEIPVGIKSKLFAVDIAIAELEMILLNYLLFWAKIAIICFFHCKMGTCMFIYKVNIFEICP